MTRVIGLTGGSGAGKSLAAQNFAALGAGIADADAIYRSLCAENHAMLDALQTAFGDILTPAHTLDRKKLAALVFADPDKLQLLNAITIPYIRTQSEQEIARLFGAGHRIVLYDAPTLFETGTDTLCFQTIGVIAAREIRLQRIITRDGLPPAAAAARIDAQPDEHFYRTRCTYILENNGTPAALHAQVHAIWDRLQEGSNA